MVTELRTIVRDRRAFFVAVVLPVLLYPVMFVLMDKAGDNSEKRVTEKEHVVALSLDELDPSVADRLREGFSADDLHLELIDASAGSLGAARSLPAGEQPATTGLLFGESVALVVARPAPGPGELPLLEIFVDSGSTDSSTAAGRLSAAARKLARTIEREVIVSTLEHDPVDMVAPKRTDLAPAEDSAGHKLGKLLPLISVMVLVSGASFAALSAFAGERESGTLETLLVQPVPGITVASGKMAAIAVIGFLSLGGNVLSLLFCASAGLGDLPGFSGDALGAGASRVAIGLILVSPTALLLCGATALTSARARTFREGQNLILPLTLGAAALTAPVVVDRVALDPLMAIIPVTGGALAFRDALGGGLRLWPAVIAFVASGLWALALLRKVGGLLDAERLLRTHSVSGEMQARRVQSQRALAWGFISVLLLYFVGGWLQSVSLQTGLILTLWVLALGLAFVAVRGTAQRAGETISEALMLRLPHWSHAAGAILLAPGLAKGMQWFATKQSEFLPIPQMQGELFEVFGELTATGRVLLFAVSPGICEELLFRGAILSGLRRDLKAPRIIAWQALLFGAVHASIYRFIPTAFVGGLMAAITLRARSIWPAIILHTSYNGLLVSGAFEGAPTWMTPAVFAVAALLGAALFLHPGKSR
ncbi:MAG: sodium transport system permease protein [Planctomycetota bacterium]|jgi:sodium transport system permease protein